MNKKKFSDSLIMIFTYTINSARMLDMNHFRQHKNHRITALVDSELKYLFTPYEPLFDDVYYFEIHYKHHCFIESFSKVAKDAIIKELALCERLKLISFFEGDIEATAKLRDQFHLSGLRFSQAQQFRNKLLMKKILTENQMLVPRGRSIDWDLPCRVLFQQCISELGFPFILKPTHLAGSLGVSLVSSYAQFVTIYHKHIDTDYMVEEEIVGDLLHLDMVVSGGVIQWFGCSQYNLPTLAFLQGRPVGSMPLLPSHDGYSLLHDYSKKIVKYFGVKDSILHIEVLRKNSAFYFIEAAARASGGLVPLVYQKMFGYNMIQADVCYQLEVAYNTSTPDGGAYCWLLLPNATDVQQQLLDLKIQYKLFSTAKPKQVSSSLIGTYDRVLGFHKDYEYLKRAFMTII